MAEQTRREVLLEEMSEKKRLLESVYAMMAFDEGEIFLRQIMKDLMIGHLPAEGVTGEALHETLGVLRAGRKIFDLLVQANPAGAAKILVSIEKTRLDKLDKELLEQLRKEDHNV